jgi:cell fate (sporulation/competence/biofilm development) regulator YlbF (YheA/YmcA/DUF963 family)
LEQVVLKKAGAENTPTMFVFSDTQMKLQQLLDDINNNIENWGGKNQYFVLSAL